MKIVFYRISAKFCMSQGGENRANQKLAASKLITLEEASRLCPYSAEYLSLRARQKKLKAVKKDGGWMTKAEWVENYSRDHQKFYNARTAASTQYSKIKKQNGELLPLNEAAKLCAHSADYLSLRARQKKLKAVKKDGAWMTTAAWVRQYVDGCARNSVKSFRVAEQVFISQGINSPRPPLETRGGKEGAGLNLKEGVNSQAEIEIKEIEREIFGERKINATKSDFGVSLMSDFGNIPLVPPAVAGQALQRGENSAGLKIFSTIKDATEKVKLLASEIEKLLLKRGEKFENWAGRKADKIAYLKTKIKFSNDVWQKYFWQSSAGLAAKFSLALLALISITSWLVASPEAAAKLGANFGGVLAKGGELVYSAINKIESAPQVAKSLKIGINGAIEDVAQSGRILARGLAQTIKPVESAGQNIAYQFNSFGAAMAGFGNGVAGGVLTAPGRLKSDFGLLLKSDFSLPEKVAQAYNDLDARNEEAKNNFREFLSAKTSAAAMAIKSFSIAKSVNHIFFAAYDGYAVASQKTGDGATSLLTSLQRIAAAFNKAQSARVALARESIAALPASLLQTLQEKFWPPKASAVVKWFGGYYNRLALGVENFFNVAPPMTVVQIETKATQGINSPQPPLTLKGGGDIPAASLKKGVSDAKTSKPANNQNVSNLIRIEPIQKVENIQNIQNIVNTLPAGSYAAPNDLAAMESKLTALIGRSGQAVYQQGTNYVTNNFYNWAATQKIDQLSSLTINSGLTIASGSLRINSNDSIYQAGTGDVVFNGALYANNGLSIGGNSNFSGNLIVTGNTTLGDATSSDIVYLNSRIGGHFIPTADNVSDIGSSTDWLRWRTGYFGTSVGIAGTATSTGAQLTASGAYLIDSAGTLSINTANNQQVIFGTGNVGIGTSSPNSLLSLYQASSDAGLSFGNSNATMWTMGVDISDGSKFKIASSSALGTSDRLTIDGTGNVGIGTTSPRSLLNIAGTRPQLTLTDTSAGTNAKHWFMSSQGGNLYVGTSTDALNATSTYLTILNGGNVGVGTTTPSLNFAVGGHCVTGDTRLRRRRKKKKGVIPSDNEGSLGSSEDLLPASAGYSSLRSRSVQNDVESVYEDDDYIYDEVAIKDIQPGDEIASLDEKTGQIVWSRVNGLLDMGVKEIYKLTTESGKQIRTTANHPYLVRERQETEKIKPQKFLRFEIDQSIRIEETNKDTIIGIANEENSFALKVPAGSKRRLQELFRREGRNKQFAPLVFAHAIITALKDIKNSGLNFDDLVIDIEYPGHEKDIARVINSFFPRAAVYFGFIGRKSLAHYAAYGVYINKKTADFKTDAVELWQTIKNDPRTVTPLDKSQTIRSPYGSPNSSIAGQKFLSRGEGSGGVKATTGEAKWMKVIYLRQGMEIAAQSDDKTRAVWDKIVKIEILSPEQVYDIEVQNTHNFIGNDIVAHNTYLGGNTYIEGNATTTGAFNVGGALTVTGNTAFSGNLIPSSDNQYDLGTSTARWRDLYLGPGSLRIYNTNDANAEYLTLGYSSNVATLNLTRDAAGTYRPFAINQNGGEAMRITGGNLGIGTTSPYSKLSVWGSGTGSNRLFELTNNASTTLLSMLESGDLNIPVATATTTISGGLAAASSLYVLQNGNVGLGTLAPAYKLDVNGTLRAVDNAFFNSSVTLGDATTTDVIHINSRLSGSLIPTADNVLDFGDSTNWLRWRTGYFGTSVGIAGTATSTGADLLANGAYLIDSGGALSINTTNNQGVTFGSGNVILPYASSTALTISGTASTTDLYVSGNQYLSQMTSGSILFAGTNGLISQNNANLNWNNTTNLLTVLGNATTSQLTTTGSAYLATTNGNVGIGTTSPGAKLAVAGSGLFNGSLTAYGGFTGSTITATSSLTISASDTASSSVNNLLILEHLSSASGGLAGIGTAILFNAEDTGGSSTSTARILSALSNVSTTSPASYLAFETKNTTGALTERLRLDSNGNLGVGTTTPYAKLSVAGRGVFDQDIRFDYFTATSTTATSTLAGGLTIKTNGLVYDWQTDNVGINTASPIYRLDVNGTLRAADNVFFNSNTTLGDATTTDVIHINSRIAGSLIPTADNVLDFGDSTNWLRWRTGYFGTSVGIAGTATSTGINLLANGAYLIDSGGALSINTTNNQGVTFGSGNVIMPYASSTALTVSGLASTTDIYISNNAYLSPMTSGSVLFAGTNGLISQNNANLNWNNATNLLTVLGNATTTQLTTTGSTWLATTGGNVGVGTTSPRSLLTIAGTRPQLTLSDTSAGLNAKHWFMSSQGGNFYIGTSSDALNATSTYLTILNNGFAGVATTSPSLNFAVGGQCVVADTRLRRRRKKKGKKGESAGDYEYDEVMIKDAEPGDEIASMDPLTGKIVWNLILGLMDMGVKPIYKLTTASGRVIRTTDNHPYFVRTKYPEPAETENQKLYRFEVDQSMKIETFEKDSVVAVANKEQSIAIVMSAKLKQRIRNAMRRYNAPQKTKAAMFAAAIVEALNVLIARDKRVHELFIDIEYRGHERLITDIIGTHFPGVNISFGLVGKESPAHYAAYGVHTKRKAADAVATELSLDITKNALRAPFLAHKVASSGSPQAFLDSSIAEGKNLVKSGEWRKVKNLKVGVQIAAIYGERVVWEKVVEIALQSPERVYDIEVQNTHNFIGNDIVAHNTYLGGNTYIEGNASTTGAFNVGGALTVTGNTTFSGNLLPSSDNAYDLGTSTARWRDLYLGPGSLRIYNTNDANAEYLTLGYSSNVATLNLTRDAAGTYRPFAINQNGSEVMRITEGNVGIGTTSPYSKLSVWGSGTGSSRLFELTNNASTTLLSMLESGDLNIPVSTATTTISGGLSAASSLYVLQNGNVGLGTLSPSYKLDVNGTLRAVDNAFFNSNVTLGDATTTDVIHINSRLSGSLIPTADNVLDFGDSTNWLRWRTGYFGTSVGIAGTATSTGTNLLANGAYLIDSNGTLSINTTNNQGVTFGSGNVIMPYASSTALTVSGLASTTDLYVSGNQYLSPMTSGSILFAGTNGLISQNNANLNWNNATNLLTVLGNASTTQLTTTGSTYLATTGGNAGVGTTSPGAKLAVAGSGLFDGSITAYGGFTGSTITATSSLTISASDTASSSVNNLLTLEHLSSASGGLVGIGSAILFNAEDTGGSSTSTARILSALSNVSTTSPASYLAFETKNTTGSLTERLRLDSNGNLGIGTTSPNQKLTIFNNAADSALEFSSASGSNYKWTMGLDYTDGSFRIASSSALGTSDRLVIDGNGNVGIGTTTPLAKLSVQGAAGQNIFDVASSTGMSLLTVTNTGQCVTGDTKLRRRRRRKKKKGEDEDKDDYIYDEVEIKNIQPGDEIASLDEASGKIVWSRVNALMDMGVKEIYKLTTADGRQIRTTGNHPYLAEQPAGRQAKHQSAVSGAAWLTADKIKAGDYIAAPKPRVGVFIDDANMFYAQKKAGWRVDYRKLKNLLAESFDVRFMNYYLVTPDKKDTAYKKTEAFLAWFNKEFGGLLTFRTKELKYIYDRESKRMVKKGNVDSEVILDAMARLEELDVVIIASGDSDYRALAETVLAKGKKVIFAGFENNMAWELRQMKHVYLNRIKETVELAENPEQIPTELYGVNKKAPDLAAEAATGVPLLSLVYSRQEILSSGAGDNSDFVWSKVKSVEKIGEERVYDIEVEGTHNFIGNGIIAHNTYISGNLGIGTTSPYSKLAVNGRAVFDQDIRFDYFTATSTTATSTLAGGLTIKTNGLVYDWQTNNVGINTASPAYKLDVNGTLRAVDNSFFNSNVTLGDATTTDLTYFNSRIATHLVPNVDNIADLGDGTNWLRWRTGYFGTSVGIAGTATSTGVDLLANGAYLIDANGTLSINTTNNRGVTFGSGNVILPYASSTALTISGLASTTDLYVSGNQYLSPMISGSVFFSGASGLVSQDNANLFWDDANNRLGIGTTSPGAKLAVAGSGLFNGSITAYGGFIGSTITATSSLTISASDTASSSVNNLLTLEHLSSASGGLVGIGSAILFNAEDTGGSSTSTARILSALSNVSTTSPASYLAFETKNTTGALTERLRLDSNGNLGVGTTTPYAKLSVAGRGVFDQDIRFDYFTATSTTATSTLAGGLTIKTNGLVYDWQTDNVGINTASPIYKLDVNGTLRAADNVFFNSNTTLGDATTTDVIHINSRISSSLIPTADNVLDFGDSTNWLRWRTGYFGTSVGIAGTATSTGVDLLANGAYLIDSGGTLSINTTNNQSVTFGSGNVILPYASSTALTVSGLASTTDIYISNNAYLSPMTSGSVLFAGTNGLISQNNANLNWNNITNLLTVLGNATTTQLTTTGSTWLATTGGNVGVGTTSPGAKLSVAGSGLFDGSITAYGGFTGSTITATSSLTISASDTASSSVNNLLTLEHLSSASGGLAGIGGAILFNAEDTGGSSTSTARILSALSNVSTTSPASYLAFETKNTTGSLTERLRLDSNGNLGIGTTTPTSILSLYQAAADVGLAFGDTNTTRFTMGTDYSDSSKFKIAGSSALGTSDLVTITTAGNVGIGTTTPSNLLSVYSATAATQGFSGGASKGVWSLGYDVTNNRFAIASSSSITSNVRMVIDNTGNVGIGTTSPLYKLSVQGTAGYDIFNVASSTGANLLTVNNLGHCVTGDTRLRRRRKKKKGVIPSDNEGSLGSSEDLLPASAGYSSLRSRSVQNDVESVYEDDDYIYDEVAIKDIQPGDEIASLDEKTGQIVWSRVNGLLDMGVKEIYKLTTASGKTIRTTGNHPYLLKQAPETEKVKPQKLFRFEVDQSGKMEELNKRTVVAAANEENSFAVVIGAHQKRALFEIFRKAGAVRYFATLGFGSLVALAIKGLDERGIKVRELVMDNEYTGYESRIKKTILAAIKDLEINFASIGKKSAAHDAAYYTYIKELKADSAVVYEEILGVIKNAPQALAPGVNTWIRSSQKGQSITSIASQKDLSRGGGQVWTKVVYLKVGQEIAVQSDDKIKAVWDKIIKIEILPPEQVYDIEVEGTHNFIGNDIVAHNTYISGNVGIGTTTPSNLLSVYSATAATQGFSGGASKGVWSLGYDVTNNRFAIASSSSITSNVRMVIDNTGNVGIGTTTPSRILDIGGTADAYMAFSPSSYNQFVIGSNNLGYILYDDTNDAYRMVVSTAGNVGIGTTTPGAKLTVSDTLGGVAIFDSTSANGIYTTYKNSGTILGYIGSDKALGGSTLANFTVRSESNLLFMANGGSEKMRITTDGNVGIGTTSPTSLLQVSGATPKFYLSNTSGATDGKHWFLSNSSGDFSIGTTSDSLATNSTFLTVKGSTGNVGIGTTSPWGLLAVNAPAGQPSFVIGSSTATSFIVDKSGNVGIGTSTPNSLLSLYQASADTGLSFGNSNATMWTMGTDISDGSKFKISSSSALGTNDRLTITTTGNVGIGTTTPNALLNIASTLPRFYLSDTDFATNGHWFMENNAGVFSLGTTSSALAVSGTRALSITNTGNVGIGTTGPVSLLHLSSDSGSVLGSNLVVDNYNAAAAPGIIFRSARGTASAPTAVQTNDILGGVNFRGYGATGFSTGARGLIAGYAAEDWTDAAQGAYLSFGTTPTGSVTRAEIVRITSQGNVGIGTTGPGTPLHVRKDQNADTMIQVQNATNGTGAYSAFSAYADAGDAQFYVFSSGYTTSNQYVADSAVLEASSNLSGGLSLSASGANPLKFWTNAGERVRIDSAGNVGIGTTAPSQLLDLQSSGTTSLEITSTGASGNVWVINSRADGTFRVDDDSAAQNRFAIDENGNLGIGTTTPTSLLQVSGATPKFYLSNTSGATDGKHWFLSNSSGDFSIGTTSDSLATNSTFLTVKGSTGNVGIGTTGPGAKLDVQATNAFTLPYTPTLFMGRRAAADIASFGLGYDTSHIWDWGVDSAGKLTYWYYNGTSWTAVGAKDSSGNVGIGTTSPRSLLNIAGTRPQLTLTDTSAGTNAKHWFMSSQGGNLYVGTSTDALNATSTYLTILNGGNVGIGTTGPEGKLHVNGSLLVDGTIANGVALSASDRGSYAEWYSNSDTELRISQARDAGDITFYTRVAPTNFERMRITSTGNVGIGTTSPGAGLQVGSGTAGHSPASTGIYVTGQSEFDADVYFDDDILLSVNNYYGFGTDYPMLALSNVAGQTDTMELLLGQTDKAIVIGPFGSLGQSFDHDAGQSHPTLFIHSNTSPDTNNTEWGSLAFVGTGSGGGYFNIANGVGDIVLNSTGNVGIGTTTPMAPFDVKTSAGEVIIVNDGSVSASIKQISAAGGLTLDAPGGLYMNSNAVEHLRMVSGVSSFTGNVGIGTTVPGGILHIAKSNANASVYIDTYDDGSSSPDLSFRHSKSDTIGTKTQTGDGDLLGRMMFRGVNSSSAFEDGAQIIVTQSGASGVTYVPTQLEINMSSNSTTNTGQFVLKSDGNAYFNNGNVGIGTTGPGEMLHIYKPTAATTPARLRIQTANADSFRITEWGYADAGTTGMVNIGQNQYWTDAGVDAKDTLANPGWNMVFGSQADKFILRRSPGGSLVSADLVTVLNTGNVGIGTTSPTSLLQVSGATPKFYLSNTSGATDGKHWFLSNSSGDFSIGTTSDSLATNSTFLTVKGSTGNVGIGTTSPSSKLAVAGGGYFDGGTITASGFIATSTLTVQSTTATSTFSTGGFTIGTSQFVVQGANGNVGIGTTGPNSLLSLYQASADTGLSFGNSNATMWTMGTDISDGSKFKISSSSALGTNDRLTITTTGNVGIGTTGPGYKLEVSGQAAITGGTNPYLLLKDSTPTSHYIQISSGKLAIGNSGSMVIDTSGNVGIGTTSPWGLLAVNAPAGQPSFVIGSSTATSFIVDKSGNVGIGTTGPLAPLHVKGPSPVDWTAFFTNNNYATGVGSVLAIDFGSATGDTYARISALKTGQNAWGDLVLQSGGGNVGIGTTGPGARLEVETSIGGSVNGILIDANDVDNRALYIVGDQTTSQGAQMEFDALTTGKGLYVYSNSADTSTRNLFEVRNDHASATGVTALYIDQDSTGPGLIVDGGNVGIGTTGPQSQLSFGVGATTQTAVRTYTVDSQAAFDFYRLTTGNLERFLDIAAVASGNDGSLGGSNIRFLTHGISSTVSATERMRIDRNGNVGIGTTSPWSLFSVAGTITQTNQKSCANGLTTDSNGSINGCVASDINLKTNIATSTYSALSIIGQLKPVEYQWRNSSVKDALVHSGFIAQDVEAVFPTAVVGGGFDEFGNPMKAIDPNAMISLLAKGLQEMDAKIEPLAAAIKIGADAQNGGSGATSSSIQLFGHCVTGDTLLPIRRRRKKNPPQPSPQLRGRLFEKGGSAPPLQGGERGDLFDYLLLPITEILPGDEVLSFNETNEEFEYNRVRQVMDMGAQDVYELTTKSGRVIRTTAEHPYLVRTFNDN